MTILAHGDIQSGVTDLSDKPLQPSLEEIYAALDAAGAADFNIERDLSPPVDRELI